MSAAKTFSGLFNGNEKPMFKNETIAFDVETNQIGIIEFCPVLKLNFFYFFDGLDKFSNPWISKRDIGSRFMILGKFN